MSGPKDVSDDRLHRNLNSRTAFVLFFISVSLITVGVVLKDARDELLMFADIEYVQYQGTGDQNYWDNAKVLLHTAGSYRNVILVLWYLGAMGLAAGASFLVLAYRKPTNLQTRQ